MDFKLSIDTRFSRRLSNAMRGTSVSAPTSPSMGHMPTPSLGGASMSSLLGGLELDPSNLSLDPTDYLIHQPIGYGSSAVVYLATYKPTKIQVAIKMIDLDQFERNQIDELRRELQIMTLSRHPNLLQVYGAFVNGDKLYIVTPYLSVGSCLDVIRLGHPEGLEEAIIATILRQALLGLDYLHKNGHIHRDVKAGNLLMDDDGVVLLADFGVSSSLLEGGERKGRRRTFVGTPCWMAPEVLAPENGYDYKADIWSFGITAIELATGHAPYARFPPLKVLMLTLSHPPPSLKRDRCKHKYSKAFKDMIDSCLQKDPTKRPTAEKLLQHSFFKQAKKPEHLVKNLLNDLPPLDVRPVHKPVTKKASTRARVDWDFDSNTTTNSTEFSADDASFDTSSLNLDTINESDSSDSPNVSKTPFRPRRQTLSIIEAAPIRRGRFHLHTGSFDSNASDLSPQLHPRDSPQIQQQSPHQHQNQLSTTSNSSLSGAQSTRKGRFEMSTLSDDGSLRAKYRTRVRFASASSDVSTSSYDTDHQEIKVVDQVHALLQNSETQRHAMEKVIWSMRQMQMDQKLSLPGLNPSAVSQGVLDSLVRLEDKLKSYIEDNEHLQARNLELVKENEELRKQLNAKN